MMTKYRKLETSFMIYSSGKHQNAFILYDFLKKKR